ncbi:hypothetical protein [Streptosporangium sp. NPDC002721]|uniref:hypothetical protein n=1 Tax=Streptosporangium sp. NPDC002721 TaxID=3366188 RepID=UPI0036D2056B
MATLRSVSSTQSTNTSFTCTKPPGAAAGDVLLAFQTYAGFSASAMTTPTGGGTVWQLLGSRAGAEWGGSKVWWKVAGPSEPAQYGFKQGSGYDSAVAIVAVSGSDGSTPLLASAENGADTSIGCPSVSPPTAPGVTVRWGAALIGSGSTSWTAPAGHTEQVERTGVGTSVSLATKARSEPGSTGSATFTIVRSSPPIYSHGFTVDVGGTAEAPEEPPEVIPPSPDIHYRFVFCDLLTDDYITDLDLEGVTFSRVIGEPGTFSATVSVPNPDVAEQVAAVVPRWVEDDVDPDSLSTGPGRTICHVYRNGIIWGTYVIWQATVSGADRSGIEVRLQGATLESYLNYVEIREDITPYEGIDQLEIARDLIANMQDRTYADIGLTTESGMSGVERDRTYLASESGTYGQRIRELADVDGGFEWMVTTSDPGTGSRIREVQFGYPKLGSDTTDHVFSAPGNVISWSQNIDALRGATSYRARGESVSTDLSTRSEPLMSDEQNATAHLTAGHPRLDATKDYSTVKELDTLNAYATKWAAERPGPVRVHQVTVRLDDTTFTPSNLGDYARLIIVNDWWPVRNGGASFNKRWRIIGISVRATSRTSQETATLTFQEETEI